VAHATAVPSTPDGRDRPADERPTLVGAAFAALDRAGGPWCLLRGEDGLVSAEEIDLLVSPAAIDRAGRELGAAGFVHLPSAGRGSHRFFHGYDPATDRWLKVDLVGGLDFGRYQELSTDLADGWLERRDATARPPTLAPDDAFWAFLLHALLDRPKLRPEDNGHLRDLARTATVPSPAATVVGPLLPRGWEPARVIEVAGRGDGAALGRLRRGLRRAWLRRTPVTVAGRWLVNRVRRRLTPLGTALTAGGLSVALLGPDGAGKSTLSTALERSFPTPVRRFYLGLYGRGAGGGGRGPGDRFGLPGRLAWLWRRSLEARWQQARGRLVVFDRHVLDLAAAPVGSGRRARLRRWLLVRACPTPDLALVLDVPGVELYRRKGEHDPEALERQRERYLDLTQRLRRSAVVDASAEPELVRRRAVAAIWRAVAEGQRR
jgi:thymidylate kinase